MAVRSEHYVPLTDWLVAQAQAVSESFDGALSTVRVYRLSSSRPSDFKVAMAGAMSPSSPDPDVAEAARLGSVLVESTAEGVQARRTNGTFTLRMEHIDGGGRSRRLLGYLTVIGRTVFVYLMASAAKDNLEARFEDNRGNAVVETLRTIVRTLSNSEILTDKGAPRTMCFTEETRPARRRHHASALARTLKHYGWRLVLADRDYDLSKMADRMIAGILLGKAEDDRDSVMSRMVSGKLAYLSQGFLPEAYEHVVPFTHGPTTESRTDPYGQTIEMTDPRILSPKPDADRTLQRLVRKVIEVSNGAGSLTGAEWDSLAEWAGTTLAIVARGRAANKYHPGVPIHKLGHPGMALRRALAPRYIHAWRTGMLEHLILYNDDFELERPAKLIREASTLTIATIGKRRYVKAWVTCPAPETGWGIDDDEWDSLETIAVGSNPRRGRPWSGTRRPLSSTPWIENDTQYVVSMRGEGSYRIESRPAAAAFTGNGRPRGWPTLVTDEQLTHHATANASSLQSAIGRELAALGRKLRGRQAALTTRHLPASQSKARALSRDLARLDNQITEWQLYVIGAEKERLKASATESDSYDAAKQVEARYRSELDHLRDQANQIRTKLEQHQVPPKPEPALTQADFSSLEAVAAGLQHAWNANGGVPAELATVCEKLFRRSLKGQVNTTGTRITWTISVFVPLKDGTHGTYTLEVATINTARRTSAHRSPELFARMFLVDQRTIPDIATEWGIDSSASTNSYAIQILAGFLRDTHQVDGHQRSLPSRHLRGVILDLPIPEVRRVIWSYLTGDDQASNGLDPAYVNWIIHTYTQNIPWGESWTSSTWTLERKLANLILNQPDPAQGIPILQACTELGVDYDTLVALTRSGSIHNSGWRTPPLFTRNWNRGEIGIQQRRLCLPTCPHPDCPARGAGSDDPTLANATVLASHILHTPETPDGTLCPACRRMPSNPSVHFPASYLQPWRQNTLEKDGTRKGTQLDTS